MAQADKAYAERKGVLANPKRPTESPSRNATFHDLELITLVGQHVEHHDSEAESTRQLEMSLIYI